LRQIYREENQVSLYKEAHLKRQRNYRETCRDEGWGQTKCAGGKREKYGISDQEELQGAWSGWSLALLDGSGVFSLEKS